MRRPMPPKRSYRKPLCMDDFVNTSGMTLEEKMDYSWRLFFQLPDPEPPRKKARPELEAFLDVITNAEQIKELSMGIIECAANSISGVNRSLKVKIGLNPGADRESAIRFFKDADNAWWFFVDFDHDQRLAMLERLLAMGGDHADTP